MLVVLLKVLTILALILGIISVIISVREYIKNNVSKKELINNICSLLFWIIITVLTYMQYK